LTPGMVELPVVVLFAEEPGVVPLAVGPPAAELTPAEPPPLWASAILPVNASAAANPIAISLMISFHCCCPPSQLAGRGSVPDVSPWLALA
jgi:hypothetical protein